MSLADNPGTGSLNVNVSWVVAALALPFAVTEVKLTAAGPGVGAAVAVGAGVDVTPGGGVLVGGMGVAVGGLGVTVGGTGVTVVTTGFLTVTLRLAGLKVKLALVGVTEILALSAPVGVTPRVYVTVPVCVFAKNARETVLPDGRVNSIENPNSLAALIPFNWERSNTALFCPLRVVLVTVPTVQPSPLSPYPKPALTVPVTFPENSTTRNRAEFNTAWLSPGA
jgi:hypothetical protein